jgi:hypothetical protein
MLDEAVRHGRELEKLGIIGVLAALLIVSVVGLVLLVRKMLTSDKDLIERGILAANNAAAAAGRMEKAATELREATLILSQITAHCGTHNGVPVQPRMPQ